jgi:uncharacterized protein (TIGR02145 family)
MPVKMNSNSKSRIIFFIVTMLFCITSCQKEPKNNQPVEVNFATVMIGEQEWMVANLDVEIFRNGDAIPEVQSDEEWEKFDDDHKPCWCYYDNDPENGKTYGKLYNYYAVYDKRGLAPAGWHVPKIDDWSELADFLGGPEYAGEKMKSTSGWVEDGNGTNESGFNGLPGGKRADFGSFYVIGDTGFWWCSTQQKEIPGKAFELHLYFDKQEAGWGYSSYGEGYSVRCVKDK